jgi:hypothetical protein
MSQTWFGYLEVTTRVRSFRFLSRFGCRHGLFFEYPSDGRHADMKTSSSQYLGDFHFPQAGAQPFEPLNDVANEIRETVNRHGELYQGIRAFFIDTLDPRSDRSRGYVEPTSRLFEVPAACGSEFQDCHPLCGWVMGTPTWTHPSHTGIFDANLLAEQSHLLC